MSTTAHTRLHDRSIRRFARVAAITVIVAAALAAVPAAALADGDPASDVLVAQPLFVPADAGVSLAQQDRLAALVRRAASAGYPVRVALIAASNDLGSVTSLWRRPKVYAAYLGDELSLAYHGAVVVVMPDGVGVAHPGIATDRAERSLANLRGGEPAMIAAAAVLRLAHAAGHRLEPVGSVSAAAPTPRRAAAQAGPWIALAAGFALIVLAWVASLRAEPPRLRASRAPAPYGGRR